MVGGSWDVFTKRVLDEKHISAIMYENPERVNLSPHTPLPTPMLPRQTDFFNY